jgi:hypothetical protein
MQVGQERLAYACLHPHRIINFSPQKKQIYISIPEKAVKMRLHFSEFGSQSNAHGRRENFYRADLDRFSV